MDVMLDLETMGSGPNAAIVAIGAVAFDAAAGELGERFYSGVTLASSASAGGVIDAGTVMWWLGQSEAARKALTGDRRAPDERPALELFAEWLRRLPGEPIIWGNGATFDNVVLTSAYTRHGVSRPWIYRNDRCYRTVKALAPHVTLRAYGTAHNALDDAVAQAEHLVKICRIYKYAAKPVNVITITEDSLGG